MATHSSKSEPTQLHGTTLVPLPRVAIKFCVQCKWNLRAAYYAQELLSTFSLSLGEVALIPSTSGTFVVNLFLAQQPPQLPGTEELGLEKGGAAVAVQEHVLWDRKIDGGFPETKELKRRVRDLVEPGRGLGHVDRDYSRVGAEKAKGEGEAVGEDRKVGNRESVETEKKGERGGEGGGDRNGTGTSTKLGDDAKYEKGDSTGNDKGAGEGEKCADCL
ncbi:hypothetical protein EPUS_03898 [Endocarpon pusillum Z07020]|uniref:Selenoprotein W-like protein n=1 Tax=Endocarpon pusillum (strain Z07020 / HMAS-L-300199) TaxID=1263415 RepID=U1HUW7_ENDPU|nr:uncharacterized protein EPUS_03898 [Endocarpon pusillum Z07020]ERF74460.1 hypothetical protein EPUS_03898 [Endocarpon pusillum Z07020]